MRSKYTWFNDSRPISFTLLEDCLTFHINFIHRFISLRQTKDALKMLWESFNFLSNIFNCFFLRKSSSEFFEINLQIKVAFLIRHFSYVTNLPGIPKCPDEFLTYSKCIILHSHKSKYPFYLEVNAYLQREAHACNWPWLDIGRNYSACIWVF